MPDRWNGRRVLITGGMGFLGSSLAHDLASRGAIVSIVDRRDPAAPDVQSRLSGLPGSVEVRRFDLCDPVRTTEAVRRQDVVYCLSGQVSHVSSMHDPAADLTGNCLATLTTLEACRRQNPLARIVYASTRQVYGRVTEIPVSEEVAVCPVDVNGIHKRAAEEYLRLYAGQFGLRSAALRLTNCYGPRMDVRHKDRGFAGVLIGRALRGEPLTIYGTGEQVRDFNYVDDVVAALRLAADLDDLSGGVWNLGDPWPCTVREFIEALRKVLPATLGQAPFPDDLRKIEIGNYAGDYTKFHNATGWSPEVTLDDGLRRTAAYFRSHRAEFLIETDDAPDAAIESVVVGTGRERA